MRHAVSLIFTAIFATILLGNGFVMVTIAANRKLRQRSKHAFVFSLALSNLMMCVPLIIRHFSILFDIQFIFGICIFLVLRTTAHWAGLIYIGSIFVMDLEQFLSVSAPLWHHVHLKFGQGAKRSVTLTWLLSSVIFIIIKAVAFDVQQEKSSVSPALIASSIGYTTTIDQFGENSSRRLDGGSFRFFTTEIITFTENSTKLSAITQSLVTDETFSVFDCTATDSENDIPKTVQQINVEEAMTCDENTLFYYVNLELYSHAVILLIVLVTVFQAICYCFIHNAVRNQSKMVRYLETDSERMGETSLKRLKKARQSAKRHGILFVTFIITNFPYYIAVSFQANNPRFKRIYHPLFSPVVYFIWFLRIVKLAFDPVLYTYQHKELRKAMIKACR